jgi:hypothetical protein
MSKLSGPRPYPRGNTFREHLVTSDIAHISSSSSGSVHHVVIYIIVQVKYVTAGVKMILFSYSNEDTKDEERRKGWVVGGHTLSQEHAHNEIS